VMFNKNQSERNMMSNFFTAFRYSKLRNNGTTISRKDARQ
jgi:hypothetical protein